MRMGKYDGKNSSGDGIRERLIRYSGEEHIAFHMPGHKRNAKFGYLKPLELDITEIDGFDDLHSPHGMILRAMDRAAKAFNAIQVRFLVNGSTVGILAAVRTLARKGDRALICSNAHRSVFSAAEIAGVRAELVRPESLGRFFGSVSPESIESKLKQSGDIKLVIVTSPTYEGVISDIRSIADVCHRYGARLIVDEAHGAHLGGYGFPKSARTLGADIVVNSLHKTLPSLTQTAILCVCSDNVDIKRLDESLNMFETSSPSYVLISSIDSCVEWLEVKGESAFKGWNRQLDKFYSGAEGLKNIRLYTGEGAYAFDRSKLVLICKDGVGLMDRLRDFGIEAEMCGPEHVVAMSGAGNKGRDYEALLDALRQIDKEYCPSDDKITHNSNCSCGEKKYFENLCEIPKKAVELYEIDSLSVEYVNIKDAEGRIAAGNIWAYPPGSPIIIKGYYITAGEIEYIGYLQRLGVRIGGAIYDGNIPVVGV